MSIRVAFESAGTEDLVAWAVRFLEEQGYYVEKALLRVRRRETLPRLSARLGVHWKQISSRLRHKDCPPHEANRGPSGRLLWVVSNEALDTWLKQKVINGRSLTASVAEEYGQERSE